MDYEKKYKDAIERARIEYKNEQSKGNIWDCESLSTIFPELKESEDERVKRCISDVVRKYGSEFTIGTVTKEKMLAWLEKQSESIEINPSEFDLRLNRLLKQFESLPKEELISSLSFYLNVVQNDSTYKEEKQCEQKPIDKVESKFKVGDWILYSGDHYGGVRHITKIDENGYYIERNGLPHGIIPFNHEICMRLWTIEDAKDGDVLCYKDEISLYKHDIKNCTKQETTFGGFVYHCCYDGKRFITDSLYSLTEQDKIDIHPATKEQRDFLFKKMKESGYEWDAEKKKLNKIEQKPTDDEMKEVLRTEYEKGRAEVIAEMQNHAWSEEDENILDAITYTVKNSGYKHCIGVSNEMMITFIKSLKDRVQPKQEWSEEDECYMSECIGAIATKDGWSFEEKRKTKHWLKSIKDRHTWKPSDEEMKALADALSLAKSCGEDYSFDLRTLYEQLKKLKKV